MIAGVEHCRSILEWGWEGVGPAAGRTNTGQHPAGEQRTGGRTIIPGNPVHRTSAENNFTVDLTTGETCRGIQREQPEKMQEPGVPAVFTIASPPVSGCCHYPNRDPVRSKIPETRSCRQTLPGQKRILRDARDAIRTHEPLQERILSPSELAGLSYPRALIYYPSTAKKNTIRWIRAKKCSNQKRADRFPAGLHDKSLLKAGSYMRSGCIPRIYRIDPAASSPGSLKKP